MSRKTLKIYVEGDARGAEQALDSVSGRASKLGDAFKKASLVAGAAFAAAGAALTTFTMKAASATTEYAVAVDQTVKKTGESAEAIQRLAYAAGQEHASMEALSKGLDKLARGMSDAAQGTGEAKGAFDALGIGVQNADGSLRSSADVLLDISDKFKGLDDEAQKTAYAMEIFGRNGAELVPFLSLGREEIIRLGDEADRLGIVLSGDNIKAFKAYSDEVTKMRGAMQGLQMEGAVAVLPAFSKVTTMMTDLLVSFRESGALTDIFSQVGNILIQLQPTVEAFVNALAGAFTAIGPVVASTLEHIGALFMQLVTIVVDSGLLDVLAEIGGILLGSILEVVESLMPVVEALAPIITQILQFVADVLNKIGPVLSEIATKVADILARILEKIEPHLDKIFDAIGKIIDAVVPILPPLLDLSMPFLDLLLQLLPPITQLVEWISQLAALIGGAFAEALDKIMTVLTNLGSVWSSVWGGIKNVFSVVWEGIVGLWNKIIMPLVNTVRSVWSGISDAWSGAWNAVSSAIRKGLGAVKSSIGDIIGWIIKGLAEFLRWYGNLPWYVPVPWKNESKAKAEELFARAEEFFSWHSGGWIPGTGEVVMPLARFKGGEFVVNDRAAAAVGADILENYINKGKIPAVPVFGGTVTNHIHFHIPGFFGSQQELDGLARKLLTEHMPRVNFAIGGAVSG